MNGRIPICRLNMKGDKHVVECLDRPFDLWYVIKTFGNTEQNFIEAIHYINEVRNKD